MLIRKNIVQGDILSINNESRKVASNTIFSPHFVLDLHVKLLQEWYPPNEARIHILLPKEMLQGKMVSGYNDFGA